MFAALACAARRNGTLFNTYCATFAERKAIIARNNNGKRKLLP